MRVHDVKDKILRAYILNMSEMVLKFIVADDLEDELRHRKDPVLDTVLDCLRRSVNRYEDPRYRRILYRLGVYALWGCVNDEAYTPFFFDFLGEILKNVPSGLVEGRRLPPEDWSVNRVWASRRTAKN